LDAWDGFNGMKEVHLLCRILDVRLDEKRVRLALDVFDSTMEAIEASGFRQRDFCGKVVAEVFVYDAIGCREEGKDMADEGVLFCR
jgi:hypothetical protein